MYKSSILRTGMLVRLHGGGRLTVHVLAVSYHGHTKRLRRTTPASTAAGGGTPLFCCSALRGTRESEYPIFWESSAFIISRLPPSWDCLFRSTKTNVRRQILLRLQNDSLGWPKHGIKKLGTPLPLHQSCNLRQESHKCTPSHE